MIKNKVVDLHISYLRIFATLAVVFLHTCSTVVSNPQIFQFTNSQGKFLLIGSKLLRFAVPVFFMISGKLLLTSKKELTYKITFKKYIRRILLALIVFGVPFAIIKTYLETKSFSLVIVIKCFLCNDSFSHLWYLYTLLAVYMILPLLKVAVRNIKTSELIICSACLMIFSCIIPMISRITGWNIAFEIASPYPIFYFLIGYCISNIDFKERRKQFITIASIIVFISITIIIIVILLGLDTEYICSYDSPVIAFYSLALYFLFQQVYIPVHSEKQVNVIWKIDRMCFAVYLIHPVFIQFIYRIIKINPCSFPLYPIATLVFFIFFVICSFMLSFILQLIPWLKNNVL